MAGVPFGHAAHAVIAAVEREAKLVAQRGVDVACSAGFTASPLTAMAHGGVANTIVEVARQHDSAMVIVGSRSHGAVRAAVLGSVSAAVVHDCDRPFLWLDDM